MNILLELLFGGGCFIIGFILGTVYESEQPIYLETKEDRGFK